MPAATPEFVLMDGNTRGRRAAGIWLLDAICTCQPGSMSGICHILQVTFRILRFDISHDESCQPQANSLGCGSAYWFSQAIPVWNLSRANKH